MIQGENSHEGRFGSGHLHGGESRIVTDAELQRKLEKLVALANELDAEAKARYGPEGFLFYEAGGNFHIMDGDSAAFNRRQRHIRASSHALCHMGAGAW
jgi:hypothetical protein